METVGKECIVFYCPACVSLASFSLSPLRTLKGLNLENLGHYWVAVLAGIPNTFPPDSWRVENT